jgi:amino acid transporter
MSDSLPLDPAGTAERPRTLTLRGATVLGIGSMIGAGISALLGEAGAVVGAAIWISFLIGGIVPLLLGYVCAELAGLLMVIVGALDFFQGADRGREEPVLHA